MSDKLDWLVAAFAALSRRDQSALLERIVPLCEVRICHRRRLIFCGDGAPAFDFSEFQPKTHIGANCPSKSSIKFQIMPRIKLIGAATATSGGAAADRAAAERGFCALHAMGRDNTHPGIHGCARALPGRDDVSPLEVRHVPRHCNVSRMQTLCLSHQHTTSPHMAGRRSPARRGMTRGGGCACTAAGQLDTPSRRAWHPSCHPHPPQTGETCTGGTHDATGRTRDSRRCHVLREHWRTGKYTILPPLKGHKHAITLIAADGAQCCAGNPNH